MDTRLAKRNYSIQQWKAIIQDRNNNYIVYSWGSGDSLLQELDIRGH